MRKINVSPGDRFGNLTVVSEAPPRLQASGHTARRIECRCNCGNEVTVLLGNLRKGHTTSCGCEQKRLTSERSVTHGMSRTTLYRVWAKMIERCYSPASKSFCDYGGRGITVCDAWRNHSALFMSWAVTNGYRRGLDIDRIDNDGNYEPSNCQFVTRVVNAGHKRNSVFITFRGRTMCRGAWERELGLRRGILYNRLIGLGWSVERALTTL